MLFILAIFSLWSCSHRDIAQGFGEWVRVNIDWSEAGISPNGATICFYPEREDLKPVYFVTHEISDLVKLQRDNYSVILFNETVDGHENLRFRDMDKYETATAYTEELDVTSKSSAKVRTKGQIIKSPDILAVAKLDDFKVAPPRLNSEEGIVLNLIPERQTVVVEVKIRVQGLNNLSSGGSVGIISGMVGEINLSGNTDCTLVRNYFGFTQRIYNDGSSEDGILVASFNSFGFPKMFEDGDENEDEQKTALFLNLRLRNGASFPLETRIITEEMWNSSDNKLVIEVGLGDLNDPDELDHPVVLPDVPNTDDGDGDTGIDAEVDDWIEEIIDVS